MKKNTFTIIIVLIIMLSVLTLSVAGGVLAKYITTLHSETIFTMDVGKRYPTITSNFINSEADFTISGSPLTGFTVTLKEAPSDFTHVAYNVGSEIKYAEVNNKSFIIETGIQETVTLEKAKMYAFATLDANFVELKIYNRLNRIADKFVPDNMDASTYKHIMCLPAGKPSASSDPEGGSKTWVNTASDDSSVDESNFRVRVQKVSFQDKIQPTSTRWWFNCFYKCTSFTFTKDGKTMLDTSQVTDMGCMFRFCHAVTDLDLSTFNTSQVKDMERMFSENKALTSLNLSGWNTANVTDMASMFWTCSVLKELDISHFNTANVTTMYQMFGYCPQLTHLNLSNFQTGKVTTMAKMFVGDTNLHAIKIGSGWKTASTTTDIFQSSTALVYLDGQLGGNTVTYTGWDATNEQAGFKVDGYTLKDNPNTNPVYTKNCPTGGNATHLAGEVLRSDLTKRVEYGEKLEYTISISSADSGGTWNSHVLTLAPAKMYSYATLPKTATADAPGPLDLYYRLNRISTKFKPDNNADADNLKIYNFWDYYYSMISDYANPEGSTAWHLLRNNNEGTNPSPVGSVKAHDTIPFVTCRNLFHRFENCTTIDLTGLDTSKAPDMQQFFSGCKKLIEVNEELLDTSSAKNLSAMFANCSLLTELNISNYDTTKVTNMSQMFSGCKKVTKLDLSTFNTSKVTTMSMMFYQCNALTSLDISSFNTHNVTAMNNMFQATKLTSLDLKHFDTSNVTTMKSMFNACSSLTSVDVSSFNTAKVTEMSYMFKECGKLNEVDLRNFDTQNVTLMDRMFISCAELQTIHWDTNKFVTSNVTTMHSMFNGCYDLQEIDVTGFNTEKVTDMAYMFRDCKALTSLDLSSFDTSNVTSMCEMFYGDRNLQTIIWDNSKFVTSNVTNMQSMFNACLVLTSIDVTGFNTAKVTDMSHMFQSCNKLSTLDVTSFDTSNVTTMRSMFNTCNVLTKIDVSGFSTAKVTDMGYMFKECRKLTELDLSSFNTQNVASMYHMFINDGNLQTITVGDGWNTDKVTDSNVEGEGSTDMFSGCTNLQGQNGTAYNENYVDKTYARVDGGTTSPGYFTASTSTAETELSVENKLSHLTAVYNPEVLAVGQNFAITLTPDAGYILPGAVTVKVGNVENPEGVTYENGVITVPAELVTEGITISVTAEAKQQITVTTVFTAELTVTCNPIVPIPGDAFTVTLTGEVLPDAVTVTIDNTEIAAVYDRDAGTITIPGELLTNETTSITITEAASPEAITAICNCTSKCGEGTVNTDCPVCGTTPEDDSE